MSKYTTVISTTGPSGNIFVIIGTATRLLRELGEPEWVIEDMKSRARSSGSYGRACDVVREFFPLEGCPI